MFFQQVNLIGKSSRKQSQGFGGSREQAIYDCFIDWIHLIKPHQYWIFLLTPVSFFSRSHVIHSLIIYFVINFLYCMSFKDWLCNSGLIFFLCIGISPCPTIIAIAVSHTFFYVIAIYDDSWSFNRVIFAFCIAPIHKLLLEFLWLHNQQWLIWLKVKTFINELNKQLVIVCCIASTYVLFTYFFYLSLQSAIV